MAEVWRFPFPRRDGSLRNRVTTQPYSRRRIGDAAPSVNESIFFEQLVTGVLSATVAAPSLVATGQVDVVGAGQGTIAAPSLSAAVLVLAVGSSASVLSAPSLVSSGVAYVQGQLASVLDAPSLAAVAGPPPVFAQVAASIPAPTLDASTRAIAQGSLSASLAGPSLSSECLVRPGRRESPRVAQAGSAAPTGRVTRAASQARSNVLIASKNIGKA